MQQPDNPNTLITNFQENQVKVRQLNEQTTEQIGAILQEKRRQQFKIHIKRIPGRKMKMAMAFGFGIAFITIGSHTNTRSYRSLREQAVQAYESSIIPFLQMMEDRAFLIKEIRREALIDFTFPDLKERKEFYDLQNPFKLSSDFIPLKERYLISNLSVPYHSQPILRHYVSNTSRQMSNIRIWNSRLAD